jgi:uncharacterized membrane protein
MDSGLKKTLLGLFILSVIIFTAGLYVFRSLVPSWYFGFFPYLVLIFFAVNAFFLFFFYRSLQKSTLQFIRTYMLATVIKLVIYLMLVLVYVLVCRESAVHFAVTLAVLYIAFTAYDLYIMTSKVKRKKENQPSPNQFSN